MENDSVSSTSTEKNSLLEGDELLAQNLGNYNFFKLKLILIPFLNS